MAWRKHSLRAGIPEPGTGQTAPFQGVGLGLECDQRLACAPLGRVGSNPTPGAKGIPLPL